MLKQLWASIIRLRDEALMVAHVELDVGREQSRRH